jgi:probable addiction module antidote protein
MALKTTPFDVKDYIETADDVVGYLDIVLEDNDADAFQRHLKKIAQSRGMAQLARQAGLSRAGLYKALSEASDPQISTVFSILKALGLRLSVKPLEQA